jgi:trehalose transport system permease protein
VRFSTLPLVRGKQIGYSFCVPWRQRISWLRSCEEVTDAWFLTHLDPTLPIQILDITGRSGPTVVATWPGVVTILVVIITYLMQEWLRADYLAGAVKG